MIARPFRRAGLPSAALLAGLALAAPAARADTASQGFIKTAIQGNLAEIQVGKLAHEKGGSDAIKALGQTLVDDHTKAEQDALATAKTLGVTPPLMPNDEQTKLYQRLAKEPTKTFDTDFINAMLQDHQKDIGAYEKAAADEKDPAGAYASKTLPALRKHMETITNVAKGMGI